MRFTKIWSTQLAVPNIGSLLVTGVLNCNLAVRGLPVVSPSHGSGTEST